MIAEAVGSTRRGDPIENINIHPEDHSEFGWFTEDNLAEVFRENKTDADPEVQCIRKGFALLNGHSLSF